MQKKITSFILIMIMLVTNLFSSVNVVFAQQSASDEKNYQINNPYATVDWKTYGQYKADFHSHSVESDGGNTPKEMFEDHYAKGYDIVALTDHNNVNTTWDRTDSTNKDATYLTTERLAEMTAGTDRNGSGITPISFTDEQSQSDHLNTFWADFNNELGATLESNIAKCQELGGISHINHPGRYTGGVSTANNGADGAAASNDPNNINKYVDLFTKYSSCVGMEIINKKDGDSYSDRILWDNILKEVMPNRPVWGFSNDDAHSTSAIGYSYNMMLMPENTEQNVRSSMENGTFYTVAKVSKRELGENFVANGSTPKITDIAVDEQNNSITIQGENYNTIEWIADGEIIATGNTIDLNDYEDKINNYVRAQLKGDGGISFTQPFGIIPPVDEKARIPEQIGLAMTADPQTSISINWTTLDTNLTNAKVMVWEKSADENTAKSYDANVEKRNVSSSTISGVTQKNFYAVTVNGLNADTEYNYRCGVSGAMSEVKSFKTAQADEKAYTFIYFSDPQVSGNNAKGWNANLDIAKQKYPEAKFIYIAGDLTNSTADEGQWEGFFNEPGNEQYNDKFSGSLISEIPVAAAMGNHDGSNDGVGGMSSHFTWASQVNGVPVSYAYTYGAARFIVINTEHNSLDSTDQANQAAFVKKEAAEAKAVGKWVIVELHKPPYTGANHLDDSDTIDSRKYWSSLLAGIGVDAVLAGHDHVLSRGFVKADGTKADVTQKVADRIYTAEQPDNAPLYYVADCGSTLKFYAPITNNDWIQPDDPIAPDYGFLDLNSSLPAGDPLNPLGPCTNDDLDGTEGFYRLPTFTAVTVSKDSIKFDAYMTGFDRDTNSIVEDTFLYDSLTVNRDGVSSVETESQLKRMSLTADANTLESDSSASIKLSLIGKDNFENEISIPSTVQYNTDNSDVLSISADGTVTVKNKPTENTSVNVWVEVNNGEKTIISNKVKIQVNVKQDVPGDEPGSIVSPVKNALDDMEERPDGSLDYDSSDLEITWEDPAKDQLIGLRFADLAIPKGAKIEDAYIQFSVDEPNKSADPFNVNIYVEDSSNSAAFENVPNTVSSRTKTTNSVVWKDIPLWTTEHEAGENERTSNLAALVQEIVDKNEWNLGNAISFILSGVGNRTAESFEGAGSHLDQVPTIHIKYTMDTNDDEKLMDTNGNDLINPTDEMKNKIKKLSKIELGDNSNDLNQLLVKAINNNVELFSGKTLNIKINTDSTVVKDIFEAIKGKDINISFEKDDIQWKFNGKDIDENVLTSLEDIDLSLKASSDNLNSKEVAKIKAVTGKDASIVSFSFNYDGELPGKAEVKVLIGKGWANKDVSICRYYADKDSYEIIESNVKVDLEGYITYTTNHCSDYFVTDPSSLVLETSNDENGTETSNDENGTETSNDENGTETSNDENGTETSNDENGTETSNEQTTTTLPKTGQVIDFGVLVNMGVLCLVIGTAIFFLDKRKKRYNNAL